MEGPRRVEPHRSTHCCRLPPDTVFVILQSCSTKRDFGSLSRTCKAIARVSASPKLTVTKRKLIWSDKVANDKAVLEMMDRVNISCCTFTPARVVMADTSGSVRTFDAETGEALLTFETQARFPSQDFHEISLDGQSIGIVDCDGTVALWDVATGEHLTTISDEHGYADGCALSADGKRFVTWNEAGEANIWDATTGALLKTFEEYQRAYTCCAFSPNGMYVVMGTEHNEVLLWDAETGAEPTTAQVPLMSLAGPEEEVIFSCCAVSPDSARIATGSYDYISNSGPWARIWDALTGATLMTLKGHAGTVNGCAFSPDGTLLATASDDGTVKIWLLATGVAMRTFDAQS